MIESESDASGELSSEMRAGPISAAKRGARGGFVITTYIIAPVAFLLLALMLVPTAIGVGSGYGLAFRPLSFAALGLYLSSALCGVIAGAIIGLTLGIVQEVRGKPFQGRLAAFFNHPAGNIPRSGHISTFPSERRPLSWAKLVWPMLFIFPGIIVVIAGLVFGANAGKVTKRKLVNARIAAERSMPGWQFADLIAARIPIPDEENSALIVAQVNEQIPESWPPEGSISEAFDEIDKTAHNRRLPDDVSNVLKAALSKNKQAVELARTIAQFKRGRHEVEFAPNLIATLLPETQNSRYVARFLAADSALRAQDGDIDGALDSARAILSVARSIGDEPFQISAIVRISICSVAVKAIERALAQGSASDHALARVQADLSEVLLDPIFVNGMRGERAVLDELLRRFQADEVPLLDINSGMRIPDIGLTAPWGRLWYDHQRAVGLAWMNELVRIAEQPAPARPPLLAALDAEISQVKRDYVIAMGAIMPVLLVPVSAAPFDADQRYRAEVGSAIVAIAVERQRLKTGVWPATLDTIDPVILAETPDDSYNGEAFRILKDDSSYRVYSIGRNLEDERGAWDIKKWNDRVSDDVGFALHATSERGRPAAK